LRKLERITSPIDTDALHSFFDDKSTIRPFRLSLDREKYFHSQQQFFKFVWNYW